jgi:hypothetical protein
MEKTAYTDKGRKVKALTRAENKVLSAYLPYLKDMKVFEELGFRRFVKSDISQKTTLDKETVNFIGTENKKINWNCSFCTIRG